MSSTPSGGIPIDAATEVERIGDAMRSALASRLSRRGYVVAMSGGIDSSVCAALAVRAVGPDRVFGLMLPERDSDPDSLRLATLLANQLGIRHAVEQIAPALEAAGCYARRDEAIRTIVPEFGAGWACKLVIGREHHGSGGINVTDLVVESPDGLVSRRRISAAAYRQVVAATNFKQRVRKMFEYYHADRLHYAVIGTPNRLEYDQGFFVKGGDGLADVKPIAHLYKSQVYALADQLGVPSEIRSRPPTTDTFSMPQTQEEFYFSLPVRQLDVVLHGLNRGAPASDAARMLGLSEAEVLSAARDILAKRQAARYLHHPAVLVEDIDFSSGAGA